MSGEVVRLGCDCPRKVVGHFNMGYIDRITKNDFHRVYAFIQKNKTFLGRDDYLRFERLCYDTLKSNKGRHECHKINWALEHYTAKLTEKLLTPTGEEDKSSDNDSKLYNSVTSKAQKYLASTPRIGSIRVPSAPICDGEDILVPSVDVLPPEFDKVSSQQSRPELPRFERYANRSGRAYVGSYGTGLEPEHRRRKGRVHYYSCHGDIPLTRIEEITSHNKSPRGIDFDVVISEAKLIPFKVEFFDLIYFDNGPQAFYTYYCRQARIQNIFRIMTNIRLADFIMTILSVYEGTASDGTVRLIESGRQRMREDYLANMEESIWNIHERRGTRSISESSERR